MTTRPKTVKPPQFSAKPELQTSSCCPWLSFSPLPLPSRPEWPRRGHIQSQRSRHSSPPSPRSLTSRRSRSSSPPSPRSPTSRRSCRSSRQQAGEATAVLADKPEKLPQFFAKPEVADKQMLPVVEPQKNAREFHAKAIMMEEPLSPTSSGYESRQDDTYIQIQHRIIRRRHVARALQFFESKVANG